MQVFREIEIEFGGETYRFTPSNKLLRNIDSGLAPQTIMGMVGRMNGEQLPLFDIAYVIAEFVKAGGGNVTEDDVLAELYDDLESNNGAGIGPMVEAIALAITPPGGAASKNQKAPSNKRAGPKKGK